MQRVSEARLSKMRVGPIQAELDRAPAPSRAFEPGPAPTATRRVRRGTPVGRWLRVGLPLAAIGLVSAVFLLSRAEPDRRGIGVLDGVKLAAGMELNNARYLDETASGEPFRLLADAARPNGPDPTEIEFDNITGDITLADGRRVNLRAANGLWERNSNQLRLSGGVVISTADGYEMRTEAALANIDQSEVVSDGAVAGGGPVGEIAAGRARITGQDNIVAWFEDGVKVTITKLVESRATGE